MIVHFVKLNPKYYNIKLSTTIFSNFSITLYSYYASCTLRIRTRAGWGKVTSDIDVCGITIFTTHNIICCWQYHIRNQRTQLPLYNR